MKIKLNKGKSDKVLEELFVSKNWGAGYSAGGLAELQRIATIVEDYLTEGKTLADLGKRIERDFKVKK